MLKSAISRSLPVFILKIKKVLGFPATEFSECVGKRCMMYEEWIMQLLLFSTTRIIAIWPRSRQQRRGRLRSYRLVDRWRPTECTDTNRLRGFYGFPIPHHLDLCQVAVLEVHDMRLIRVFYGDMNKWTVSLLDAVMSSRWVDEIKCFHRRAVLFNDSYVKNTSFLQSLIKLKVKNTSSCRLSKDNFGLFIGWCS